MAESSLRTIHRMSKDVADKITTAQVVISLAGALRQLIDNSIDAAAKTIEVRVKNYGIESLEVQDNGHGIEVSNFELLCKPHSTSKLSNFSDFDHLATLGFRGEALNALCALSTITIFTRAADSEVGTRLKYDHAGNIVSKTSLAREIGTTVIVENLFETLPVRRKELERTAKKDFPKLLVTVQSFSLMKPTIKFLCSNMIAGKRQSLICTPGGNSSIKEVVLNLFGGMSNKKNSSSSLIEIKRELPDEEICALYSLLGYSEHLYDEITLAGFVSSCEHGSGRSSADRQFVYINNRPIEYYRVCRVVNEVYQQYNKSQYPILVLFIGVPAKTIDVNVTPDKKTVLFDKEKHLLALLRASLIATFRPVLGLQTSVRSSVEDTRNLSFARSLSSSSVDNLDESLNSSANSTVIEPSEPLQNIEDLLREARASSKKGRTSNVGPPSKRVRLADVMAGRSSTTSSPLFPSQRKTLESYSFTFTPHEPSSTTSSQNQETENSESPPTQPFPPTEKILSPVLLKNMSRGFHIDSRADDALLDKIEQAIDEAEREDDPLEDDDTIACSSNSPKGKMERKKVQNFVRTQQNIKFSMANFKDRIRELAERKKETPSFSQDVEFHSVIRPEDSEEAEKELDRALKKADFGQMKIIGQFNKGFIISRFGRNLFIIDQHASDEKYNFEKLQKNAKISMQPLLTPASLNFGAVQEMIIRDNIEIFRANGFDFKFVDRGEDGCMKAYMTSRPQILSQNLTNQDLDEIVSMVAEYPGQMYRPTKIRKIFASRACRSSIMIGTSLNEHQMRKVVRNLGHLDQPWNCPHGRPTIRHLFDLSQTNLLM
ncbi:unnamed protein product [Caenorhabditis auriculariae]|uniref:Uncharacterized protein n=1 Tax=Caenorhabditis auriculariae TaxID=2777116 RepID=A0A8S1H6K2_9PELO|nr:unnamed protein product [Caenorhabditis auriculariae]